MEPDVTIVIPTRDRAGLVSEAIASCRGGETSRQVVVVDDASTDATPRVLEALGDAVTVLRNPVALGASGARNVGIGAASGRYLKFLDSDDVLVEGALDEEVALGDAEEADIVVSDWFTVEPGPAGELVERRHHAPVFDVVVDDLLAGLAVPTSAALYRRSGTSGILWDPAVRHPDDWDWFLQCAVRARRIVTRSRPAYYLRWHAGERETTTVDRRLFVRGFYLCLDKLAAVLRQRGELTEGRRRRLAQYYYKELRWLANLDRDAAMGRVARILELDPLFVPRDEERHALFSLACRLLGLGPTIRLYSRLRSKRA